MTTRAQLHSDLLYHLSKAQVAMKWIADSHRHDVVYNVGDWFSCAFAHIVKFLPDHSTQNSLSVSTVLFASRSISTQWLMAFNCQHPLKFILCFMYLF